MTMRLELSFFFYPLSVPLLLLYYTTDTFLSLLVIALSWTYLLCHDYASLLGRSFSFSFAIPFRVRY